MSAPDQKSVLVVDDSSLMRRLITEIVQSDPDLRVVDVAENGKVALQKVRQHRPDCVLLDIEMPELSGLDTLRRLHLRSSAKVVILSHLGHDAPRVRAEALRLGAVDVIDKPTGAVSRDLRNTRGIIIRQTLRRVLGLPELQAPDEPLAADGGASTASILSVNIQSFASLCERVEVTVVIELINEHLALVDEMVQKHDGIIEAHISSATLTAFGIPHRRADHALCAVSAGSDLLEAVESRRAERRHAGAPFVDVGVAVVTGVVLAGELGPPGARRYRTMGGAIDLAAHLGRSAESYGAEFVICGRTLGALGSSVPTRRLDVVELGPDTEPIALYEVLSVRSKVDNDALQAYARGMEHYEVGQFAKAIKAFDEFLQRKPLDRAATQLRSRCRSLLGAPSGAWRGVWPLDRVRG